MKFSISFRGAGDSIKAFYLTRSDRVWGGDARIAVLTLGLTTADRWIGAKGMVVIGGWPDCTGGHKASQSWHFPLIGMQSFASAIRKPRWFWSRWAHMASWLQYRVIDTRYRKPTWLEGLSKIALALPPGLR